MAARDLAKELDWRRMIQRHARSGKSVRAFCLAERINEPSFHYWRRTIQERDRSTAANPADRELDLLGRRRPDSAFSSHADPSPFLPVRIGSVDLTSAQPKLLEVELAGGSVLRIPAGFDPDTIRNVIGILEDAPC